VGPASSERQAKAEELAAQHGYAIVPPYNDDMIIAGQGTMGLEILEDLPEVETVIAPVGGGGMLSGIATAVKLSKPTVKVIGAEPELAADAQASLRSGKIVESSAEQVTRTLADGLRTQSIGPLNFEHIRRYVDDIVTVSEDEIRKAMQHLAADPRTLAEPSGAVAVAAFLFHRDQLPRTTMNVAVISGGNVEAEMLAELKKEVDLLPRKCMNIFRLAFYEGLDTNAIARKLGLSVKTVRNQKAKAVQLIRVSALKKNLLGDLIISLSCISPFFHFL